MVYRGTMAYSATTSNTRPRYDTKGSLLCALSGAWWMLWHALFWTTLSGLVFFMSLHLEYNTQVDLDKRNDRNAAYGNPKPRREYAY